MSPLTGPAPDRLGGLRRFAVAITVLNVLGHTIFGFEQSWLQPLVALVAAYATELILDQVEGWASGRPPRFTGGWRNRVDFLLSAHITALAVAMLLYANDRLWPIAFAAVTAIASKAIFRTTVDGGQRHFFNPSNLGITATLLLFPWVGIAPPYHFTENLTGAADWILPGVIVASGTFLNARFTGRLPLIAAWTAGFLAQAWLRNYVFGLPLPALLLPATGVAFILFTFYMVTDPATTPAKPRAQLAFGLSVAAAYGVLTSVHVVFGLFFALTSVCSLRGVGLYLRGRVRGTAPVPASVPLPAGLNPRIRVPEAVALTRGER